ncbi:MAG: MFS transporter [Demequinaceae bacterium]|nr:MFS transporter [Demequinaceae bacterium]
MSTRLRTRAPVPLVLLALASGAFAIGASQGGSGGVMLEQAQGLGTTNELIGISISAYALGVVVSAPLLAILLARQDRRSILLWMMAIAVVFNALTAIVPNISLLIGVRFLSAIPHGVFLGAGSVVGARVMGPNRRGRAMAIMMAGYTVAIIVAVPLMKWISANVSWRWAFASVALASLVSLILVAFVVPSVPARDGAKWRQDVAHLRGRTVWAAIAFVAIGFAGFGAVFSYIVPILQEVDLLSVNAVSAVLAINGIAMTITTLVAGKVTDASPARSARIGMVAAVFCFAVLSVWGGGAVAGVASAILISAAAAFVSQGAQTHFMDVVHASPMLGAAMSHASLNLANAAGAAAGAVVIGAGLGYLATAWVAFVLTLAGLAILTWGPGFRKARTA